MDQGRVGYTIRIVLEVGTNVIRRNGISQNELALEMACFKHFGVDFI